MRKYQAAERKVCVYMIKIYMERQTEAGTLLRPQVWEWEGSSDLLPVLTMCRLAPRHLSHLSFAL